MKSNARCQRRLLNLRIEMRTVIGYCESNYAHAIQPRTIMASLKSRSVAWLLFLSLATIPVVNGATNLVTIGQSSNGAIFFFNPTNLTINPGDTVRWTNTVFNTHDT